MMKINKNINNKTIKSVDICCGLAWGDEAKGKITVHLCQTNNYDFVCRWAGGNNAGHTIYINNKKYVTNLIPSGIFYGINSIIGPDCVLNIDSFFNEVEYLKNAGFDTSLIKISPKTHIITNQHIMEDINKYSKKLGTTAKGIAPCYRDKYGRTGLRACDYKPDNNNKSIKEYLWDEELYGNILCEGAQGFWLDINMGNYPYITSSNSLPYSACSLGFPPNKINNIYGAAKIYDTRVGIDPDFPEDLFNDIELNKIGEIGEEYGTTTGRRRKVNWLNMDKLIKAINISGTNILILSKVDVIKKAGIFKYYYNNKLEQYNTYDNFIKDIKYIIYSCCEACTIIHISDNPHNI